MTAKLRAKNKKKFSDCLEELLSAKVTEEENNVFLEHMGIKKSSRDNRMLVMAKLLERAISGETSAIKEVRSIMMETESQDAGLLREILEAVKQVE